MKFNNKTLILLCGGIASGKTTFSKKYFDVPVFSSDHFRYLISGDENNQNASRASFEILFKLVEERMKFGQAIIIDNLNHTQSARNKFYTIADKYGYKKVVIVFDVPLEVCKSQNSSRERVVDNVVVEKKYEEFKIGIVSLKNEDCRIIQHKDVNEKFEFYKEEEKLTNIYHNDIHRAIIIGDVHNSYDELRKLLDILKQNGYDPFTDSSIKLVSVGDWSDRGPKPIETLDFVCNLINSGNMLACLSNHDFKLKRYLKGNKVKLSNGLDKTVEALNNYKDSEKLKNKILKTLESLPDYLVLDDDKLVICHGAMEDSMLGKNNDYIKNMCMFGKITGKKDEHGFPERIDFAAERVVNDSSPLIIHGHVVVPVPILKNKVLNIDTGCSMGGRLTAYIYPDNLFFQVNAEREYWEYKNFGDKKLSEAVKEFKPVNEL